MTCPSCGATGATVCGMTIPEVWDGVLYWLCLACDHAWPRDFGDWDRLNARSDEYARMHNDTRNAHPERTAP